MNNLIVICIGADRAILTDRDLFAVWFIDSAENAALFKRTSNWSNRTFFAARADEICVLSPFEHATSFNLSGVTLCLCDWVVHHSMWLCKSSCSWTFLLWIPFRCEIINTCAFLRSFCLPSSLSRKSGGCYQVRRRTVFCSYVRKCWQLFLESVDFQSEISLAL